MHILQRVNVFFSACKLFGDKNKTVIITMCSDSVQNNNTFNNIVQKIYCMIIS